MREVPADRPGRGVIVHVTGGRSFRGEVDFRTDSSTLWLHHGLEGGFILRPVDWGRVGSVELEGDTFSGEEFREAVAAAIAFLPPRSAAGDGDSAPEDSFGTRILLGPSRRAWRPPTIRPLLRRAEVRSLAVEARLGNWDADVEPDGLVVEVFPLGAGGQVVAVNGTLEVQLVAERVGMVQRPEPFDRLGRWSQPVREADFVADGGASYRLPFQSVDPERDSRWGSHGMIHARLSVPANGVFEATASMVRIHAYSAVRDRLEQTTGRRYLPGERTGLGNR